MLIDIDKTNTKHQRNVKYKWTNKMLLYSALKSPYSLKGIMFSSVFLRDECGTLSHYSNQYEASLPLLNPLREKNGKVEEERSSKHLLICDSM